MLLLWEDFYISDEGYNCTVQHADAYLERNVFIFEQSLRPELRSRDLKIRYEGLISVFGQINTIKGSKLDLLKLTLIYRIKCSIF